MTSRMVYAAKEPLESRTAFYSAIPPLLQERGKPTKNFRNAYFEWKNIDALSLAGIVTRGEFWKHMKWISFFSSLSFAPSDYLSMDSSFKRLRNSVLGQTMEYKSLSLTLTENLIGRLERELSVTHVRDESLNEAFQARLETLVNAMSRETIDEGYSMPSEDMFLQLLQRNKEDVSRWFHALENDESDHADLISKIIYMTSHISFETISQAGTTFLIEFARKGLMNTDLDVQEAAIGAFENWRGQLALDALHEFHSSEPWLQQYVNQIISELEEELSVDGVPGSQDH